MSTRRISKGQYVSGCQRLEGGGNKERLLMQVTKMFSNWIAVMVKCTKNHTFHTLKGEC